MLTTFLSVLILAQCSNGSCSQGFSRSYRTYRAPVYSEPVYVEQYSYSEPVVVQTQPARTAAPVVAKTSVTEERLAKLEKELADTKASISGLKTSFDRLVSISENQEGLMKQQLDVLTAIKRTTEQFDLVGDAPTVEVRAKSVRLLDTLQPPPGGGQF